MTITSFWLAAFFFRCTCAAASFNWPAALWKVFVMLCATAAAATLIGMSIWAWRVMP